MGVENLFLNTNFLIPAPILPFSQSLNPSISQSLNLQFPNLQFPKPLLVLVSN